MTKNTISFRTQDQKTLWDNEIRGQLSDGCWENAVPSNHWKVWCDAETVVDPDNVGRNFRALKDNYDLVRKDLLEVVAGRMLVQVKATRLFGQENAKLVEYLYEFCSDKWSGGPTYTGEYFDNIRDRIGEFVAGLGKPLEYIKEQMDLVQYDLKDLVRDLQEMKRTIRFYNAE